MTALAILSDIHYAGAAEQARGELFHYAGIDNPILRLAVRLYRNHIWLRNPLGNNVLLDNCLAQIGAVDHVIANGDYSCDTAFVGVSDDAACQSARECLQKLRQRFGESCYATFGDHELGKRSMIGGLGGMRIASWQRARGELNLQPLWRLAFGRYVLVGVTSSLLALPVYAADVLPDELREWERLRTQHLADIRDVFGSLSSAQRVLLFCHDPSALPFLWREDAVRQRMAQLEHTIIGHLHSNLILWQSRVLAGMPSILFLGHTTKRHTVALNQARYWKPFRVRLCPSLAGIELLKDGGFYTAELDADGSAPARFVFHRIPR